MTSTVAMMVVKIVARPARESGSIFGILGVVMSTAIVVLVLVIFFAWAVVMAVRTLRG